MPDFELDYPQIANTELWELLVRKSEAPGPGREFVTAVGQVCAIGLNLSRDIIRFFPAFTLHDDIHSANVCRWMYRLLGDRAEDLTAYEAALLLMSACCHDIGMSVSDAQKEQMMERSYPGWDAYFKDHLADDEEYCENGAISQRMLRSFVRLHHHERIAENLRQSDWPELLTRKGIRWEDLLNLCRSHGTDLNESGLRLVRNKYDMRLCAVLLRLADLLDYDAGRAPEVLFRHMGLDAPENAEKARSAAEQKKNQAGAFDDVIENGVIFYNARFESLQQEREVREYLDWVEQELSACADHLALSGSRWKDLPLPYKISTEGAERVGYASGEFRITMDQDKVITLLTGKNLYSDPGVFVRELLQNSIDAVLMRARQDPAFTLDQGRIIIDTWPGEAGDTWFRIRDNGTGMDEHIITNYFLKVGRSYYTSDEFRAANRHAPGGKAYTAISRFGIGVLSCFMTDPEHTQLQVATKRFRGEAQNGIRLNVTGLHGYYYLAHEKSNPVYEDAFLEMPSPDGENRGYREEPGTTICVRTNLFRMGTTQSFRDILDKYVQFPEVRVEYNGPEGHKEYPIQQELMDTVHALNPDGEIKEYVHEISDAHFAELKEAFPGTEWDGKPAVVFRYYPVDWLSDSENLTGAVMEVDTRCSASCPKMTLENKQGVKKSVVPKIGCSAQFAKDNMVEMSFSLVDYGMGYHDVAAHDREKIDGSIRFEFPVMGGLSALAEQEQTVSWYLMDSVHRANARFLSYAYNGVMAHAEIGHPFFSAGWEERRRAVMLLRGEFLPEVNMARTKITGLPPEAACCCEIAWRKIDYGSSPGVVDKEIIQLITERELRDILNWHPVWEEWLLKTRLSDDEEEKSIHYSRELVDMLRLAAVKRTNSVFYDFSSDDRVSRNQVKISELPLDSLTEDFPAGMFFLPETETSALACVAWITNFYNRSHPFSRWLIANRVQLVEQVPAMYDTLIRAMMRRGDYLRSVDADIIRNTVNSILTRLRSFDKNCFGIYDGLFLTDKDFVTR